MNEFEKFLKYYTIKNREDLKDILRIFISIEAIREKNGLLFVFQKLSI